jgi:hypothetical protein
MIKMVNPQALDGHEEECERKLSTQMIADLGGKPKKLTSSRNPIIKRHNSNDQSPEDAEKER